MFNLLKEKLKNWVKKNEEKKVVEEKSKKKGSKKEKKDIIEEKRKFLPSFKRTLTNEKFEGLFEELELILLQGNVSVKSIESIKDSLKESLIGKNLREINLSNELKKAINKILINPQNFIREIKNSLKENKDVPFVILFAGINGSGKTTTIAKIAYLLKKNSISVCLAAADTFRAASIEQLNEHANNLKIPLIKKYYGADPASVGFDAINYSRKNKIDVVLIDTAGRMQNKDSLMQEIKKIERVNHPHMKIFLGESITGNDATEQAKAFDEAINITGIILSKTDIDEKGGTAISVSNATGKPILFLGIGQEYKDLEIFNKKKLIEKLGL